jgi:flavin-dependent dehydrogenase
VVGANFRTERDTHEVRAQLTILATGANATALDAFGLQAAKKPTAVAGRAYYEATADVATELSHLVIAYQREWCPGYGWIFPAPGNRFNIGVGLFGDSAQQGRLHAFFDHFCRSFPPAVQLIAASRCIRPFRGAPIRSGLDPGSFGRLGLLAAGEAVATTYAATGEGIGKAMESGILAAEFAGEVLQGKRSVYGLEHAYRREFEHRFINRYVAYDVAQRWARRPWMLNLLAQRATAGRFVKAELEALIAERGDASHLFSTAGLLKSLVG